MPSRSLVRAAKPNWAMSVKRAAMLVSLPAVGTTLLGAVLGKGLFRLVPILAGVAVGYWLPFAFAVMVTRALAA